MEKDAEESLRERLSRERQERREAFKIEQFQKGDYNPISKGERVRLERSTNHSLPTRGLKDQPIHPADVRVGLGGNPITFYAWREGQIGTFSLLASGSFTPLGAPP